MANNLLYALTRAASRVLAYRSHEEEVEAMNRGRLPNLPMVGNTDTLGGIKMGSLAKIAEVTQNEKELCGADNIKIACAHLTNYLAASAADGRQIKTASLAGEINTDRLVKCARLYVIDELNMYKEAGIDMVALKEALLAAAAKVKGGIVTGARAVGSAGKATGKWVGNTAGKKGVQIGAAGVGGLGAGFGINELLKD